MKNLRFTIRGLGFIAIVIMLLWWGCNRNSRYSHTRQLYEQAAGELTQVTNEKGQQQSKIALLTAQNKKQLLNLQSKDSTILQLQALVGNYKGRLISATVASTTTGDIGSTPTTVSVPDTVWKDSLVYPVYKTQWDEQWTKGRIVADRFNISRAIQVRNEYEFTQGYERAGKGLKKFFGPKKPVLTMVNLNPNTVTDETRSVVFEQKRKWVSIGPYTGVGFNERGEFTYQFGFGAQLSLIRL